jgi:SAM-dependent methyltransferase
LLRTWHIAYRHHDLMNPSSPDKLRVLGERLRLRPGSTVLDLGCGTGGPAVLLASAFGCSVLGVDHHEPFIDQAHGRAADAGVSDLVEFIAADGAEFIRDRATHVDAAVCIGAAWILGGFAATADQLGALVPPGGHVAIGDTFRRSGADDEENGPALSLAELVDLMAESGLAPITVLESSPNDWHNYTSLMWLSIEDWIEENPTHPEVERFRQDRRRGADLAEHRHGWAIVAGRQTGESGSDGR